MLSREFSISNTIQLWDFIFSLKRHFSKEDKLTDLKDDPLANLEYVVLSMVILKREDILQGDFSQCLGILMKYKEPSNVLGIIRHAVKIKNCIRERVPIIKQN